MEQALSREARNQLRRQLIVFFLATFAFSWGIFAIALAFDLGQSPVVILGIWGPTVSAVAVTGVFYGRHGLGRFFARLNVARGLRWFIPLLVFFLAIGTVGGFVGAAASGIDYNPGFHGWAWVAQVMIMQLLIPGLGEEFGWRGFALHRLQHVATPLKATLTVALFHFFWHAPTYWLGQGMHNVPAVWAAFFLLPWSILFTWVYNRSNGSILVAVFFHATSGATLSYTAFLPSENAIPVSTDLITMLWLPDGLMGPYLGVALLYWALALYILRGGFGGLGTPPAPEHPIGAQRQREGRRSREAQVTR